MTLDLSYQKAAVLALTRHQIRSLVKAAQARDQAAMDLLEESWDAVAGLDPELTAAAEHLCSLGQEEDLARFEGFRRDEEREVQRYMAGAAGRLPRLITGVAALLLITFALGGMVGVTALPLLLVAVAVSSVLVVAGGVMSVQMTGRRFDHIFRDPAMACEHVWVAATDNALALVLLQRPDLSAKDRDNLLKLTEIWTEAGLAPVVAPPTVLAQ